MLLTNVSELSGNLSILCWLFAQLPQIFKNYQTKSVEGLSLPFLLNWLSGDLTNLIGCLLTHQLIFQRNLAIYFNLVDLVIIYQFILYYNSQSTLVHPSNTYNLPGPASRSDIQEADHLSASSSSSSRSKIILPSHPSCASESSLKLAISHHQNYLTIEPISSPSSVYPRTNQSLILKPVFLSGVILTFLGFQAVHHYPSPSIIYLNPADAQPQPSWSSQAVHHPHSAFVHVSSNQNSSDWPALDQHLHSDGVLDDQPTVDWNLNISDLTSNRMTEGVLKMNKNTDDQEKTTEGSDKLKARIGKISAWLCAFLYLTSRIPQIMKNFERKSVEGLSMMLFILAFLGNLTYVISILSSPKLLNRDPTQSTNYLSEAIPYLIGSAGTLCFDLTIFLQSQIYRPSICLAPYSDPLENP